MKKRVVRLLWALAGTATSLAFTPRTLEAGGRLLPAALLLANPAAVETLIPLRLLRCFPLQSGRCPRVSWQPRESTEWGGEAAPGGMAIMAIICEILWSPLVTSPFFFPPSIRTRGLLLMLSLAASITEPQCNLYSLPGCPRNFNPVCGTDGETYANECMLCMKNREEDKDIQIAYNSACS